MQRESTLHVLTQEPQLKAYTDDVKKSLRKEMKQQPKQEAQRRRIHETQKLLQEEEGARSPLCTNTSNLPNSSLSSLIQRHKSCSIRERHGMYLILERLLFSSFCQDMTSLFFISSSEIVRRSGKGRRNDSPSILLHHHHLR